jgi:hypothetical protein
MDSSPLERIDVMSEGGDESDVLVGESFTPSQLLDIWAKV